MKTSTSQLKKFGKKIAAIAMGILAAAALALGALVDSPDELFTGTPQAAQVVIAAAEEDARTVARSNLAEPSQKVRLRDKLRRLFFAQPSVVRGVVLLPFWAVGKVLLTLFSLLFTALSPIFQIILGVLFNALLLFGLFALVFKLLFPHLSLRKLLTKRNIILLTAGALLLSAADTILRANWEDYRPISIAIKLGVGLIVLSLLAWRIFGKRVPRKTAQAT
jgi:hypothetical protein